MISLSLLVLAVLLPVGVVAQTGTPSFAYSGVAEGDVTEVLLLPDSDPPALDLTLGETTGAVNSAANIIPDSAGSPEDESEDFSVGIAAPLRLSAGGDSALPGVPGGGGGLVPGGDSGGGGGLVPGGDSGGGLLDGLLGGGDSGGSGGGILDGLLGGGDSGGSGDSCREDASGVSGGGATGSPRGLSPFSVQSSAPADAGGSQSLVNIMEDAITLQILCAETQSQAALDASTAATQNDVDIAEAQIQDLVGLPAGESNADVSRAADGTVTGFADAAVDSPTVLLGDTEGVPLDALDGLVTAEAVTAVSRSNADGTTSANTTDFDIANLSIAGLEGITLDAGPSEQNPAELVTIVLSLGDEELISADFPRGVNLLEPDFFPELIAEGLAEGADVPVGDVLEALEPVLDPVFGPEGLLDGTELIIGGGFSEQGDGTFASGLIEAIRLGVGAGDLGDVLGGGDGGLGGLLGDDGLLGGGEGGLLGGDTLGDLTGDGGLLGGGGTAPDPGGTAPDPGGTAPDPGGTLPDPGGTLPDPGGTLPDPGGTLPDPGGTLPLGTAGPGDAVMMTAQLGGGDDVTMMPAQLGGDGGGLLGGIGDLGDILGEGGLFGDLLGGGDGGTGGGTLEEGDQILSVVTGRAFTGVDAVRANSTITEPTDPNGVPPVDDPTRAFPGPRNNTPAETIFTNPVAMDAATDPPGPTTPPDEPDEEPEEEDLPEDEAEPDPPVDGGGGGDELPFTGLGLAAIAAMGGLMLAGGSLVRRLSGRREVDSIGDDAEQ